MFLIYYCNLPNKCSICYVIITDLLGFVNVLTIVFGVIHFFGCRRNWLGWTVFGCSWFWVQTTSWRVFNLLLYQLELSVVIVFAIVFFQKVFFCIQEELVAMDFTLSAEAISELQELEQIKLRLVRSFRMVDIDYIVCGFFAVGQFAVRKKC